MDTNQPKELRKPNKTWLLLGFVFGIMGGFFGILIGGHFAFGSYGKRTKRIGWTILIISLLAFIGWNVALSNF